MGILLINRNLLSKFKPKYLLSSDLRRIFSQAAGTTTNPQAHHAPTVVVGDLKPNSKSMFLIEHVDNEITNYSQLSAAEINNNSWKDNHRAGICIPFSGEYDLVGSCKEWTLFWLWNVDNEDSDDEYSFSFPEFSLWNPTTNCIKTLPPPSLERPIPCATSRIDYFGFGFDPKSQDYKLVRFLQYEYLYAHEHIELYSLKTNSWKHITPSNIFVTRPRSSYNSIHVNGVYYWASHNFLSFDFADEEFSCFSLPDDSVRMSNDFCLAEFHGSLAVILPYLVPVEDLTEEEKQKQLQQPFSIKIWVWNGETWDVGPRVAVGDFPAGDKIARAIALFRNEYLFLQGCAEPELMLFNCKTGTLEKLGIHHDALESSNPSFIQPSVFPYTVPI